MYIHFFLKGNVVTSNDIWYSAVGVIHGNFRFVFRHQPYGRLLVSVVSHGSIREKKEAGVHTVPYPLSPPPAGIKSKGLKMGKVIKGRRKGSKRNERSYIVGSTKRQHFIKTIQIYMNKTQKYVIITKWGRKSTIYQTCGEEIAFG